MSTATTTNNAADTTKTKAKRSPQITVRMMLEVIQLLAWDGVPESEDAEPNTVTHHDIAKWFNSHEYDASRPCSQWKDAEIPGTRPGTSIYQWLNAKRKEVGDLKEGEISPDTKAYIESVLDCVETSEAKETDFDDIVGGLKSLGFLRVPSNMVQGGSHKGTNGQPVGKELVDTYRLKPE